MIEIQFIFSDLSTFIVRSAMIGSSFNDQADVDHLINVSFDWQFD